MTGSQPSTAALGAGTAVRLLASGGTCRVIRSLGRGGQGEVFAVEASGPGLSGQYALKWYHRSTATPEQRAALVRLVDSGRPHERFLWPLDLAEDEVGRSFGYLMALRPPAYRSVIDLVAGKGPWSARIVATVGYELADSFNLIHSKGLCYRDINFGNAFYDPDTGGVLICDNDNVSVDGSDDGQVLGAPYFMAPEIVRGTALPSARTDLFSLAVLLFYLLIRHHPLLGALELQYDCLDRTALEELFGHRATFIFDPADETNRPVPEIHEPPAVLWPMMPSFIRRRFTEAFTVGLNDPWRRVGETIWKRDMIRLRDSVFPCQQCGAENLAELPRSAHDPMPAEVPCWSCGAATRPRYVLHLGSAAAPGPVVALSPGIPLFDHHLRLRPYSFGKPGAHVSNNPRDPLVWGLTNDGADDWHAVAADGGSHSVAPGRTIRLESGLRVEIGSVTGIVTG